jgi:hypothetical protein
MASWMLAGLSVSGVDLGDPCRTGPQGP